MKYFQQLNLSNNVMATSDDTGAQGISGFRIANYSGLNLRITFGGTGVTVGMLPGEVNVFDIAKGYTGIISLLPTLIGSNASSFPTPFYAEIQLFGAQENVPHTNYPQFLNLSTNIGSPIVAGNVTFLSAPIQLFNGGFSVNTTEQNLAVDPLVTNIPASAKAILAYAYYVAAAGQYCALWYPLDAGSGTGNLPNYPNSCQVLADTGSVNPKFIMIPTKVLGFVNKATFGVQAQATGTVTIVAFAYLT